VRFGAWWLPASAGATGTVRKVGRPRSSSSLRTVHAQNQNPGGLEKKGDRAQCAETMRMFSERFGWKPIDTVPIHQDVAPIVDATD
jgi:hypothetical protein